MKAFEVRITSIRSRGKRGGVIFAGVADSGERLVVRCDYSLVPDAGVVDKGQVWRVEGRPEHRNYQADRYTRRETQIEATLIDLVLPSGKNLIDWIANSDDCPGIGKVLATRLYQAFGESLLQCISNADISALESILTAKQATALCSAFKRYNIAETLFWLDRVGIPQRIGRKVLEYFGDRARERIESNPYLLISFWTDWELVDGFARSRFGIDNDDARRLSAAADHVLYGAYKDGHTCLPPVVASQRLKALLSDVSLVKLSLNANRSAGFRVLASGNYQAEGAAVIEATVASRLLSIARGEEGIGQRSLLSSSFTSVNAVEAAIADFELALHWPLGLEQRTAVETCIRSRLSLILGGAGTGKTTVLRCLYDVLEATQAGVVVYQMALAGRAAQRMTEATGRPSMTIAAFLARVQGSDLSEDSVIVVDESSMVDVILAYRLLNHIPPGAKLILVGDPSQLAPIGPGLVLHALAGQSQIPQVTLTEIRRQTGASGIPRVAEAVRSHQIPVYANYFGKGSGVSFVACSDRELHSTVLRVYEELGGSGTDFAVQLLTITVDQLGGAKPFNQALHAKFRAGAEQVLYLDAQFGVVAAETNDKVPLKVGDLIIFGRTDEELQLRNGSLGRIVEALPVTDEDSPICVCDFEGVERKLSASHLESIRHAYAITIHKSQGSQFDRVVIPIRKSLLLDQSLIYTAITRGVQQVVLAGDIAAAAAAIQAPSKANRRFVNLPALLAQ